MQSAPSREASHPARIYAQAIDALRAALKTDAHAAAFAHAAGNALNVIGLNHALTMDAWTDLEGAIGPAARPNRLAVEHLAGLPLAEGYAVIGEALAANGAALARLRDLLAAVRAARARELACHHVEVDMAATVERAAAFVTARTSASDIAVEIACHADTPVMRLPGLYLDVIIIGVLEEAVACMAAEGVDGRIVLQADDAVSATRLRLNCLRAGRPTALRANAFAALVAPEVAGAADRDLGLVRRLVALLGGRSRIDPAGVEAHVELILPVHAPDTVPVDHGH